MKTKTKTIHRCRECGFESGTWRGRCPECQAWQSLDEVVTVALASRGRTLPAAARSRPERRRPGEPTASVPSGEALLARARALDVAFLGEVPAERASERIPTGLVELDRVLGGGLVPGAATLLGGDPGIGKSTLVLQLAYAIAASTREGTPRRVLYVAGEESPAQLRRRAERLGFLPDAGERAPVFVLGEVELERALAALELAPDLVIVDSMQVLRSSFGDASPGTVSQVRDVAHALVEATKARGVALLLVGHVTKEGTLAGPRVVEHLVDQVLSLEGEAGSALRVVRCSKNRFGDATETGVLEMTARGLVDIESPSHAFLQGRIAGAPGSCVLPTREGSRPYLVEIQALVTEKTFSVPSRRVNGVDPGRAAQVLAVLEKRGGLVLREQDVFLSATAGARVREPAADLALAVSCASSLLSRPVPADVVILGELGLAGELREVPGTRARLLEAARLGFRRAVVPPTPSRVRARPRSQKLDPGEFDTRHSVREANPDDPRGGGLAPDPDTDGAADLAVPASFEVCRAEHIEEVLKMFFR
jgi:DNA repair protein RadA/Sms